MIRTIIATLAGLAIVLTASTMDSQASVSAEATFCQQFARFGTTPSYRNLVESHNASDNATKASRRAYSRFESALLAGSPRSVLRRDVVAVYSSCR